MPFAFYMASISDATSIEPGRYVPRTFKDKLVYAVGCVWIVFRHPVINQQADIELAGDVCCGVQCWIVVVSDGTAHPIEDEAAVGRASWLGNSGDTFGKVVWQLGPGD
jgi:hypothetical protein